MRHLLCAAAVAALAIAGCREAGEPQAPSDPLARKILGILTQAGTATRAERLGKIAWYSPETLYEYVNGMAPYYADAGFQRLAHSEWKSPDAEAAGYVELDLFDMGSPEGALDIFSDLRTEGTKYLEIGNEASASDSVVEIRAGRYYVKLTARRGAEKPRRFLETLAEAVAEAAGPGPSDAELVAPLPAEGMIPHTAAYTTKAFLGHDFLNGAREAAYDAGGQRVRLFIMDAGDAEEARGVWQKWRDSVSPPPEGRDGLPNAFAYEEEYVGGVIVAHQNRYVAGGIGKSVTARRLLETLIGHLEAPEDQGAP